MYYGSDRLFCLSSLDVDLNPELISTVSEGIIASLSSPGQCKSRGIHRISRSLTGCGSVTASGACLRGEGHWLIPGIQENQEWMQPAETGSARHALCALPLVLVASPVVSHQPPHHHLEITTCPPR